VFAVMVGVLLAYRVARHYLDLRVEGRRGPRPARQRKGRRRRIAETQVLVGEAGGRADLPGDVRRKTFRLALPGGGPLPFEHVAGQYLNLALTIDGRRVNRSYTIASSPTRSAYCEISVKRLADGRAWRHLHDTWREGSVVQVSAPAGKFVFAGHEARRVVLLAGGVGITPMMSVVPVRQKRDVIFEDELAHLERRFPNLHVCVTLSDAPGAGWDGARGRVSRELVEAFVPELKRGRYSCAGPSR
jgi:glycine betaine catabolism B